MQQYFPLHFLELAARQYSLSLVDFANDLPAVQQQQPIDKSFLGYVHTTHIT
ncbi:MAG: hypothetical protein V2I36_11375 [Desulfopila sp.]|jgi:hypothetical protein|nr:hypothetical protein [Desulfopila sp.]